MKRVIGVSWQTDSIIDFHNERAIFFSIASLWVDIEWI